MITIEAFICMVNRQVMNRIGLSIHDLPDYDFASYYEEDFSIEEAREAAKECAEDFLAENISF